MRATAASQDERSNVVADRGQPAQRRGERPDQQRVRKMPVLATDDRYAGSAQFLRKLCRIAR